MQEIRTKFFKKLSSILTIGERIASIRKLRHFSQASLALESGRTRSAIAQIETNAMRPDYEFIRDVVRILNTTYEYIFGETENPEKGVTYLPEKGGNLKGNLIGSFQNDLYIKSPAEDARRVKVQIPEQEIQDISFSEPRTPLYSDLRGLIEQQRALMRAIVDRLEALEQAQALQRTPHLPGGEKSPV